MVWRRAGGSQVLTYTSGSAAFAHYTRGAFAVGVGTGLASLAGYVPVKREFSWHWNCLHSKTDASQARIQLAPELLLLQEPCHCLGSAAKNCRFWTGNLETHVRASQACK